MLPLQNNIIPANFTFHHIGIATKDPLGLQSLLQILGFTVTAPVYDPLQDVNLVFCSSTTAPNVEIIYQDRLDGHINTILKDDTHKMYHLCFTTTSFDLFEQTLTSNNLKFMKVGTSKPAILFENNLVAFYYCDQLGIIELLQENPQNVY